MPMSDRATTGWRQVVTESLIKGSGSPLHSMTAATTASTSTPWYWESGYNYARCPACGTFFRPWEVECHVCSSGDIDLISKALTENLYGPGHF